MISSRVLQSSKLSSRSPFCYLCTHLYRFRGFRDTPHIYCECFLLWPVPAKLVSRTCPHLTCPVSPTANHLLFEVSLFSKWEPEVERVLPTPCRVLLFALYLLLVCLLCLVDDRLTYLKENTRQCFLKCKTNGTDNKNDRYSWEGEVELEVGFEQVWVKNGQKEGRAFRWNEWFQQRWGGRNVVIVLSHQEYQSDWKGGFVGGSTRWD